jgi:hypothetical protein
MKDDKASRGIDGITGDPLLSMFIPQVAPSHKRRSAHQLLRCADPAKYVGDLAGTDLPDITIARKTPLKSPFVVAINFLHLQIAICFLAAATPGRISPAMNIFRSNLDSLIHISHVLGSDYLLMYACRHLVEMTSVLRFCRFINTYVVNRSPELAGEMLIVLLSPVLAKKKRFQTYALKLTSVQGEARRAVFKLCRGIRRSEDRFWEAQHPFVRCAFCHVCLDRSSTIMGLWADVQILPCCFGLCHGECLSAFLLENIACSHQCTDALLCVQQSPRVVYRRPILHTCRSCTMPYCLGRFASNDVFGLARGRVDRVIRSNTYNNLLYLSTPDSHMYSAFVASLLTVPATVK